MEKNIKIALLEDHPVFRTGLKLALTPLYQVAIETDSAVNFFEQLRVTPIDLVILDLVLTDYSGIEVARQLKATHPDTRILVFSIDLRNETMKQLIEIGVDGFMNKRADEEMIREAVATILKGQKYFVRPEEVLERDILAAEVPNISTKLTERERDIMLAFCKGLSSKEIAAQMCISQFTVENHKQHIFAKFGIHNVVELVTYAIRNKIIILS